MPTPTAVPNAVSILAGGSKGRSTANPGNFLYPSSGSSYQSQAGNAAGSAYNQGQGYTGTAGQGYSTLFGQGNALTNLAGSEIGNLLNAYLGAIGVGGANGNATGGVGKAPAGGSNPYTLSQPEQQQLNAQLDSVNLKFQDLQNQTKQALIARGIDPSTEGAAATEYLQAQQEAATSQLQANFMENIRQTNITNAGNALAAVLGINNAGIQAEVAGAGGTANLGNTEFGAQSSLNGVVQGDAATNTATSIVNDLGAVLGAWAGGGFSGGGGGSNALLNLLAASNQSSNPYNGGVTQPNSGGTLP